MNSIKRFLFLLGYGLLILTGLGSIIIDFQIVVHEWGLTGAVISFMLIPMALAIVPFFALVKYGIWYPLIITYAGSIISYLLIGIGDNSTGGNVQNE